MEDNKDEIAIVGIGCNFPGGKNGSDKELIHFVCLKITQARVIPSFALLF